MRGWLQHHNAIITRKLLPLIVRRDDYKFHFRADPYAPRRKEKPVSMSIQADVRLFAGSQLIERALRD